MDQFSGGKAKFANTMISQAAKDRKISLNQARRQDRLHIVSQLAAADFFDTRGAAEYVAEALGVSRSNVYDLLTVSKPASTMTDGKDHQ